MSTKSAWEDTALRPFMPLLDTTVEKVIILKREDRSLLAATVDLATDSYEVRGRWLTQVDYVDQLNWQPIRINRIRETHDIESEVVGLVVMPSVLADLNRTAHNRTIQTIWRLLDKGDFLMLGSINSLPELGGAAPIQPDPDREPYAGRRFLDSLFIFRALRKHSTRTRAYVCFGRDPKETLNLVACRYRLQHRFVVNAAYSMSGSTKYAHRILSALGIYPWLEREHILVAEKC